MRIKSLVHPVLGLIGMLLLLSQLIVPAGCANQVPPLGGPRDSIPPVLMAARPGDSSRNFTGKRIVFEFNEYVQLENATQNLLISPTPKINPKVDNKLRTVTVEIQDTLEENTTYTFNFGNAIKDVNEGNVMKDFTYTFSTGPTLDSLQLAGKVIIAETGKTDSTIIAALYRDGDDSTVVNQKPRYIARVDKDGNYLFKNLPAGTFYLYAFKDEGGTKTYNSKNILFAFADKPVVTGQTLKADTLYAYVEEKEVRKANTSVNNRPAPGARNAAQDKRLRFETNLEAGEQDLLTPLEVYFKQAPLKMFDSTKVQFLDDKLNAITNYTLRRDSSNTKLILDYKWVENAAYSIVVDKDFAEDSAGRRLTRNDTLRFKAKSLNAYAELKWRFVNIDLSKNPVLQFVQGDQVVYSHAFVNRDFTSKYFKPGEYDLRILYDENKNGKWDPGTFFGTRKQPERVLIIPRKITVKTNFTNETDFTL